MSLVPPVGVALLSFAHAHQEHWATSLAADPRAIIRAVWDADPRRGAAAAARYATTFEGFLDTVLGRPDVQAVTICSETCRHAERRGRDPTVRRLVDGRHEPAARARKRRRELGGM